MAAEFPVMHLEIRHRATRLAPPAIATQNLSTQTFATTGDPAASGQLLGESFSGRLLKQVFEERLLLFAG